MADTVTGDLECRTASVPPDDQAQAPWLLVVARGHARLVAEIQAIFRGDSRIRVIENREGQALLPRPETFSRVAIPSA